MSDPVVLKIPRSKLDTMVTVGRLEKRLEVANDSIQRIVGELKSKGGPADFELKNRSINLQNKTDMRATSPASQSSQRHRKKGSAERLQKPVQKKPNRRQQKFIKQTQKLGRRQQLNLLKVVSQMQKECVVGSPPNATLQVDRFTSQTMEAAEKFVRKIMARRMRGVRDRFRSLQRKKGNWKDVASKERRLSDSDDSEASEGQDKPANTL